MNLTPEQKLSAARILIRDRFPYFRHALHFVIYTRMEGLGTYAMTNDGRLLWDPEVVERETLENAAASVMHELLHFLRDHAARCKTCGAEPRAWNIAADAEINDDIRDMGLKLPDGCVFAANLTDANNQPMVDGNIAEVYYGALRQGGKLSPPPGQGQGQGDDGSGSGEGAEQPQVGAGWCGGVAGRPNPKEPQDGQGKAASGKKDGEPESKGEAPGRSEAEGARVRKQVAEAVIKHAAQKGRGSVPGGFLTWAENQVKPPKIDWRQKLSHALRGSIATKAGHVTTTWRAFGRKQSALGFGPGKPMTPKWVSPVPRVAVALDTSGSMGTAELSRAAAEVAGILKTVNSTVDFVACDARIHATKKCATWQDAAKEFKGGGGTDFRPVFEHFADPRKHKGEPPQILVFITDGMGPAPEVEPAGLKTIWVLVGGMKQPPVSWGSCIVVDE